MVAWGQVARASPELCSTRSFVSQGPRSLPGDSDTVLPQPQGPVDALTVGVFSNSILRNNARNFWSKSAPIPAATSNVACH